MMAAPLYFNYWLKGSARLLSTQIFNLKIILVTILLLCLPADRLSAEENTASRAVCDLKYAERCLVPADTLSNQEKWSFRFYDNVIDSYAPRWKKYKNGLNTLITINDCLDISATSQDNIDLTKLRMDIFEHHSYIEICMFRIADTLKDAKEMAKYLSMLGYNIIEISQSLPTDANVSENFGVLRLQAMMPVSKFQQRIGLIKGSDQSSLQATSENQRSRDDLGLIIEYSKSGRVVLTWSGIRGN